MFYNKAIFHRCFNYPKKYWYKNIRNIPLYFRLIHELVKYGYDEYATWETFNWFSATMKSVLIRYKEGHQGVPVIIEDYPIDFQNEEANAEIWDKIIDRMIELLDLMQEDCSKYEHYEGIEGLKKRHKEMDAAKCEFFNLFSKHYWDLWD